MKQRLLSTTKVAETRIKHKLFVSVFINETGEDTDLTLALEKWIPYERIIYL